MCKNTSHTNPTEHVTIVKMFVTCLCMSLQSTTQNMIDTNMRMSEYIIDKNFAFLVFKLSVSLNSGTSILLVLFLLTM